MDRRLLGYYNRELQHLRETGAEFAREFPKIAGRLALEEFTCADPYVERLLEGFAFLSARVQLKLDAEFPRFTQNLLETVYPHYLAPTPSMAVVQFQPKVGEASLVEGYALERNTPVKSAPGRRDTAAVEFRTAHDVTLWPFRIVEASYHARDLGTLGLGGSAVGPGGTARAAFRIRLETNGGIPFNKLAIDSLPLFIRGAGELQMRVYEHLFRHATHCATASAQRPVKWAQKLVADHPVRQVGFNEDESMLPFGPRSFQGYRLLHEYFAFPQRFLFFAIDGLRKGLANCAASTVDLLILLSEADLSLENAIDATTFAPFCTPVVNLFPKRCDRVHVTDRFAEFHVVPDRTRPRDYEVYKITSITGFGQNSTDEFPFAPFYSAKDVQRSGTGGAYYSVNRVPRMTSERENRTGARAKYDGSDVYVSLVDPGDAPYPTALKQLGIETLCTNRDLPLLVPTGGEGSDFNIDTGAPVVSVRCVSGVPTAPKASPAQGDFAWRLISHLTLNYLSLVNSEAGEGAGEGASALRDLLSLYGDVADATTRKQIEGVKLIGSRGVVQRIWSNGPIAFGRGVEVDVTLDESAFQGTGVFLLGAVLERFFAKYVSINSFTRTNVRTVERGEVMRWKARFGQRQVL